MGDVVNLDAVRASKNKKESPIEVTANFHEPVYKEVDKVEFGLRTQVLSDAITRHTKKIGALLPNQKLIVDEVTVNKNISFVKADIVEADKN